MDQQPNMRLMMGRKQNQTSTRQEHRFVAFAMLLVLFLSLSLAHWLSQYRTSHVQKFDDADWQTKDLFVDVDWVDHSLDSLNFKLPSDWKQVKKTEPTSTFGVVNEAFFALEQPPYSQLHLMQLDVGLVRDPQAMLYAAIKQSVSTTDLETFSEVRQWARRHGNRLTRRLLAVSKTHGIVVLHHLYFWTHDGRTYWAFYARTQQTRSIDSQALKQFDQQQNALGQLAEDTRFTLATSRQLSESLLGDSTSLAKWHATCDRKFPGSVLLYSDKLGDFCIVRLARSALIDPKAVEKNLAWQFEMTMKRKIQARDLEYKPLPDQTSWWTLHYPAAKDIGIGPEPMSRDVHIIQMPQANAWVLEVAGPAVTVKQMAQLIPDLIGDLTVDPEALLMQDQALALGQSIAEHAPVYLKKVIQTGQEFSTMSTGNKLFAYTFGQVTRQDNSARGNVRFVYPASQMKDTFFSYRWQLDWGKSEFFLQTTTQERGGKVQTKKIEMSKHQIVGLSDTHEFETKVEHVPWPVLDDHWPVKWAEQKGLLNQWFLMRLVSGVAPPQLHWIYMTSSVQGYRVIRRPIDAVDAIVYSLDHHGQFLRVDGFKYHAYPTGAQAVLVQRITAEDVYNQWPAYKKIVEDWITKDASTDQ